ncbi:MAG TPA: hypothetical protein VFV01_11160 [Spirillospora sp.]|nr:hypothetical protein [Spirillospora sp.]
MYAALNPLDSTSLLSSAGAVGVLPCTANVGDKVHLSLPLVLVAAMAGAVAGAQTDRDRAVDR